MFGQTPVVFCTLLAWSVHIDMRAALGLVTQKPRKQKVKCKTLFSCWVLCVLHLPPPPTTQSVISWVFVTCSLPHQPQPFQQAQDLGLSSPIVHSPSRNNPSAVSGCQMYEKRRSVGNLNGACFHLLPEVEFPWMFLWQRMYSLRLR